MAYIKSKNIKMYPSGYRGLIDSQYESGETVNCSYNPESKLNTEHNAVKPYSTLITYNSSSAKKGIGDVVISKDWKWSKVVEKSTGTYEFENFEFIVKGYYFKILDSYDAFNAILSGNPEAVYVKIKLADGGIQTNNHSNNENTTNTIIDEDNVYITERHLGNLKVIDAASGAGSITPTSYDDGESNITDYSSLDNYNNQGEVYEFTGIALITDTTTDQTAHYFKILETKNNDYIVPEQSTLIMDADYIKGGYNGTEDKKLSEYFNTKTIESLPSEDLNIKTRTADSNKGKLNITSANEINIKSESTTTNYKGEINITAAHSIQPKLNLTADIISDSVESKVSGIHLSGGNSSTGSINEWANTEIAIKLANKDNYSSSNYDTGIKLTDGEINNKATNITLQTDSSGNTSKLELSDGSTKCANLKLSNNSYVQLDKSGANSNEKIMLKSKEIEETAGTSININSSVINIQPLNGTGTTSNITLKANDNNLITINNLGETFTSTKITETAPEIILQKDSNDTNKIHLYTDSNDSKNKIDIKTEKVTISGTTTITGELNVSNDLKVNTNKFTVTAADGNTGVGGTLTVASNLSVTNGIVTFKKTDNDKTTTTTINGNEIKSIIDETKEDYIQIGPESARPVLLITEGKGNDQKYVKIKSDDITATYLTSEGSSSNTDLGLKVSSTGKIESINLAYDTSDTTASAESGDTFISDFTIGSNGKITGVTKQQIELPEAFSEDTLGTIKGKASASATDTTNNKYYVIAEDGYGYVTGITAGATLAETAASNQYPILGCAPNATVGSAVTTVYEKSSIKFDNNGQLQANSFYATSDKRLKENLRPLDYNKSILDLPVYKYDYINGAKNQIGCMAQDLQELYPELVYENFDGYLSVDNSKVVYLLLEEVKLLKKEIEELKKNR